jgi:dihydrodipicolinate synthase/N-acetylneuraminate lyase
MENLNPNGIIPALSTITDNQGNLDEESQRSLVQVNIEWGANALAVSIVAGE